MTITIRFWRRNRDFKPDYNKEIKQRFTGENAASCMEKINRFRENHDLAKFTHTEIVFVED